MREIFLVSGDSTESSLVFRASEEDGTEEFFIAVTDELHAILAGHTEHQDDNAVVLEAVSQDAGTQTESAPELPSEKAAATSAAARTGPQSRETATKREEKELDPRLSAPLTMSPREIQVRIRSGATIAGLAEENGVTESRIEPYAHPVLLERARIAELAKQSHPVRENGPAKLTLWEILATAFATRGHDLTTARWDAYRDATNQWIVRVDWKAGLSDNHAEWTLNLHNTSSPTADPRTPVAADLIDPEFIQPIRTLTSIGGNRYEEDASDDSDDFPRNDDGSGVEETMGSEEELATRPAAEEAPKNRRRKAVTPHWEDVLLGVRANTKRPKK